MSDTPLFYTGESDFVALRELMASRDFLSRHGLGAELDFFLCPYPAAQGLAMEAPADGVICRLAKELTDRGIKVCHVDLYDLALARLERRHALTQLEEYEQASSDLTGVLPDERAAQKRDLDVYQTLHNLLGIHNRESDDDVAKDAYERVAQAKPQAVLLSGAGAVFPFIRTHVFIEKFLCCGGNRYPTVLFFPGTYADAARGTVLNFCGRLPEHYYRANNVFIYARRPPVARGDRGLATANPASAAR